MKKIDNLEIAKLLLDVRRRSILDIAREKPVTVAQIAEELNEKPSRLYYHVKMLEDAALLELAETRQHGNLIEKFYKTAERQSSFNLDPGLLLHHSDEVMVEIMKVLEPGLKLLSTEMKRGESVLENQVNLTISFKQLTGQDWLDSHNRMNRAISDNPNSGAAGSEEPEENKLPPDELERKSRYAYVVLSYRIEDAEKAEE